MDRTFAFLVCLAVSIGHASATSVAWLGATRLTSLKTSTAPGHLVFYFTPSATVAQNDLVTLTASENIFAANGATTCTALEDGFGGTPRGVTSSAVTTLNTLKVTMNAPLTLNKVAQITCTSNLANNGATAQAVTFDIETTTDTGKLSAQTGYTLVAAASPTWGAATVGGAYVGLAAGALSFTFTPNHAVAANDLVTLTADKNIFAANAATTCTALTTLTTTGASGAAAVTGSAVTTLNTLKVTMGAALMIGHTATITCTTNMGVNPAAGAVAFSLETTNDNTAITAQTGYTTVTPVTSALAGVSRGTSTVKSEAGGDLVFAFTPRETVANTKFITLTASEAIFANTVSCTCTIKTSVTASSAGATVAITAGVATSTTALKITAGADMLKDVVNVITCTANLDANGATAQAVTFEIESNVGVDVTKWGIPGYTLAAAKSVIWGSVTRATSLVTAVAGGDIAVTFTPNTAVAAAGIVTITPSSNIFTADAATTCTATSGGKAATVTSSATVGAVLKVTMGAALTPGYAAVITCTSNLANNGAAGAITFAIETSTDTVGLTAQTGYTITAAPASNSTGSSSAASSNPHTTVTQAYTFPSLTTATYTDNTKGNMECAYANNVEAATTPTWCVAATGSRTYKAGIAMSSSVARRAATVTFTLKVDTTVLAKSALETKVATSSTAAKFAAALTAVNTGTGFNITDPGTATNVATATFTSSTSGASSLLPSMLGLVSALFICFKHM